MATKSKPEFSVISGGIAGLDDVIQEKSQERLILVDVHQEWSGPCSAIFVFLNQLWVDLEDANKKIGLYTLGLDDSSTQLVRKLQALIDPDVKLANQGCKPLFVLFKNGQCVGTVDGVNTPVLSMLINLHVAKAAPKK